MKNFLFKLVNSAENLFLSKEDLEEIKLFSTVMAVGVYADTIIKEKELQETLKLISDSYVNKGGDFIEKVYDTMMIKIEEYEDNITQYYEDELEIVEFILLNNRWDLAEALKAIFEADGYVANDEGKVLKKLNDVYEAHSILTKEIENRKKEMLK